jgi:NAD/NADP transhydrogenase beta subunit
MLGIYIKILLAVPVLIGLKVSLRERHLDRRHFISFVGFTAALVAVTAAATHDGMYLRQGVQSSFSTSSAWKVLLGISGLTEFLGCIIAFVAGLFSIGRRRIFLIALACFLSALLFIGELGRQGT